MADRYGVTVLTPSEESLGYVSILDRAPGRDALAYWSDQLEAGASRLSVLEAFSRTGEAVL